MDQNSTPMDPSRSVDSHKYYSHTFIAMQEGASTAVPPRLGLHARHRPPDNTLPPDDTPPPDDTLPPINTLRDLQVNFMDQDAKTNTKMAALT